RKRSTPSSGPRACSLRSRRTAPTSSSTDTRTTGRRRRGRRPGSRSTTSRSRSCAGRGGTTGSGRRPHRNGVGRPGSEPGAGSAAVVPVRRPEGGRAQAFADPLAPGPVKPVVERDLAGRLEVAKELVLERRGEGRVLDLDVEFVVPHQAERVQV